MKEIYTQKIKFLQKLCAISFSKACQLSCHDISCYATNPERNWISKSKSDTCYDSWSDSICADQRNTMVVAWFVGWRRISSHDGWLGDRSELHV